MGTVSRMGEWLGLGRRRPVAGISFSRDRIVVAALRTDPVRLTAIARREIVDGAIVAGDIRLPHQVATALAELRRALRLPSGTACVLSVDPLTADVRFAIDDGEEPVVAVDHQRFDRATFVAAAGGFRPTRIDVVPAALARAALTRHPDGAAVRTADGWSILAWADGLDGSKRSPAPVRSLHIGPDLGATVPVADLEGVAVARRLGHAVLLDRDLEAIGAGLAHFGLQPLVAVSPTAARRTTGAWTVETVDVAGA